MVTPKQPATPAGFCGGISTPYIFDAEGHSKKETKARAEAALKRMLATPPKPHKDSKLGRKAK